MPRLSIAIVCAWAVAFFSAPPIARGHEQAAAVMSTPTCPARVQLAGGAPLIWHSGAVDDASVLDTWCHAVGPPFVAWVPTQVVGPAPPALDDLVVLTWNLHLAEGRLSELVSSLRAGRLTNGQPVRHFVLLLQELYRRGEDVPALEGSIRSAYAIRPRDPRAPDAREYARALGLSMLYIPSMRNGADMLEDRGNAIVSSEPLVDGFALELPFERQRRVAVGAAVQVQAAQGITRLSFLNAHLEPLSSPSSFWVFRNPRRRQMASILDLLRSPRVERDAGSIGTVLGGDFNTIQGGVEEDTYLQARTWSTSLTTEDRRRTHHMGRIDHLFFRLADGWTGTSTRVDDTFGSDHHPVLGRFIPPSRTP